MQDQLSKFKEKQELDEFAKEQIKNLPKWLNVLFFRLSKRYDFIWSIKSDSYAADLLRRLEWLDTLQGVSLMRIGVGLQRLKENGSNYSEYAPNAMQFKSLCDYTADELNIPSFDLVYQCVGYRDLKHDFVAQVCKNIDIFNFINLPSRDRERKLLGIYDLNKKQALREGKVYQKLIRLEGLPILSSKLSEKDEKLISAHADKTANDALSKMYAVLGVTRKIPQTTQS